MTEFFHLSAKGLQINLNVEKSSIQMSGSYGITNKLSSKYEK